MKISFKENAIVITSDMGAKVEIDIETIMRTYNLYKIKHEEDITELVSTANDFIPYPSDDYVEVRKDCNLNYYMKVKYAYGISNKYMNTLKTRGILTNGDGDSDYTPILSERDIIDILEVSYPNEKVMLSDTPVLRVSDFTPDVLILLSRIEWILGDRFPQDISLDDYQNLIHHLYNLSREMRDEYISYDAILRDDEIVRGFIDKYRADHKESRYDNDSVIEIKPVKVKSFFDLTKPNLKTFIEHLYRSTFRGYYDVPEEMSEDVANIIIKAYGEYKLIDDHHYNRLVGNASRSVKNNTVWQEYQRRIRGMVVRNKIKKIS